MKNSIITIIAACFLLMISACSTIKSTTYIEPNKSFVLGQNVHGNFKATVKNTSINPIEVYTIQQDGKETMAATLQPNEKQLFKVGKNVGVKFKNLSSKETAKIEIKANGERKLSMGYINS